MPVLMQLLSIDNYDDAIKWCEEHPEDVKEGYTLSKEAIIVWTMLSSQRFIKQGVRINCTLPSPTQTPMMSHFESATPLSVIDAFTLPTARRSTPEEQAGGVGLQVPAQGLPDGLPKEDNFGMVALRGPERQFPSVEIHVGGIQGEGGSQPDAGGQHQPEEHLVPFRFRSRGCGQRRQ